MNLPNSGGERGKIPPPKSSSLALMVGSARPALISLLSLLIISDDVWLGAPTPNQVLASYPGKNSPTVGMSGSPLQRVGVVTASARKVPWRMYSIDVAAR